MPTIVTEIAGLLVRVQSGEPHKASDQRMRRSRAYLLPASGEGRSSLSEFVEADVDDALNLFHEFNGGTHGSAGRSTLPPCA
jgi:hypothetical protein